MDNNTNYMQKPIEKLPPRGVKHGHPRPLMETPGFWIFLSGIVVIVMIVLLIFMFKPDKTAEVDAKDPIVNTGQQGQGDGPVTDLDDEQTDLSEVDDEEEGTSPNDEGTDSDNGGDNSTETNSEAENYVTYEVKSGDTLYRISQMYYGNRDGIERIKEANSLKNDTIYTGMKLKIPSPTKSP